MPDSAQLFLLPWENPLRARVGADFFRELPPSAGVYLMLSVEAEVLYVGKSKNLRSRVASYASVHPTRSSRKLCRLVHQIAAIQIREVTDENAALRLEAELIRQYRPKFNTASTHPESNVFWGLRWNPEGKLETRWTRRESVIAEWDAAWRVHGALRSTAGTAGIHALRRLLWWRLNPESRSDDWPRLLLLSRPAEEFVQPFAEGAEGKRWRRKLEDWLETGSPAFVHRLGGRSGTLVQSISDNFTRALLSRDFEVLQNMAPPRATIDRAHPLRHAIRRQGYLAQAQLDDLAHFRRDSSRSANGSRKNPA
jgi:predicted GIY-YIG superfamily endonuclease